MFRISQGRAGEVRANVQIGFSGSVYHLETGELLTIPSPTNLAGKPTISFPNNGTLQPISSETLTKTGDSAEALQTLLKQAGCIGHQ